MIKKIFAILLIFSFAVLSAGVLYPVKNRKANAVIVIPPDADREWADALLHLPEKYRLPLVLHALEGYSLAEVAQIIHLPVNTVKTRISRARKQMRQEVMDNAE